MPEAHPAANDGARLLGREFTAAVVMFHEAVGRLVGLSAAERKCLDLIDRLGPVTAGQIAQHTGLTTGAITGMVDRLSRAGYLDREPNPADRRSVLIARRANTPLDAVLPAIFEPLADELTTLAARYSPDELAAIADWSARTTEILRRRTEDLSTQLAPGSQSRAAVASDPRSRDVRGAGSNVSVRRSRPVPGRRC